MSTFARGVITTESGAVGIIQSVNHNTNLESAEIKDEKGNTKEVEFFDPTNEVSIETAFDVDSTPPALTTVDGQIVKKITVTLSNCKIPELNGKYCVINGSLSESNTDFHKYSMNLKRWFANNLPAEV